MYRLLGYLLALQLISVDCVNQTICGSLRIHNFMHELKALENCTVVEGNVKIIFYEKANEEDFKPYSFPELREITDYLLVYNVKGLRSLGQLFPNLEKIGGDVLSAEESALIIFKAFSLQEIGLRSLKQISRGNVVVFRNYDLCYVDTVDWKSIMKWDVAKTVTSPNQDNAFCPTCPQHCPGGFCWNNTVCQIEDTHENCHPLCVSGCRGPSSKDCYSCRGYRVTILGEEEDCVEQCPKNMYTHRNWRCVTRAECVSSVYEDEESETKQEVDVDTKQNKTFVIFDNACVKTCPAGYQKNLKLQECVRCDGKCEKTCKGGKIESVSDVRLFKGCDIIKESLLINVKLKFTNTVRREFEEGLGSIKEIRGYLKITRSTVPDLKFLKNLSAIKGKDPNDPKVHYAISVLDNDNLQELWDWNVKPKHFEIKGKVSFHYNPKLCLQKIYEFLNYSKYDIESISNFEVGKESNGEKFPCNIIDVNFLVIHQSHHYINISIPIISIPDTFLLRYVVHFTKDPFRRITVNDDLNPCSDNDWRTIDISVNTNNDLIPVEQEYNISLTDLSPDTQYVFYVTLYTSSIVFARSGVNYITTLPSTPSELTQLQAISNSSSQITVEWSPPTQVNGNLKDYIVTWFELQEDISLLERRNYCDYPLGVESNVTESSVLTHKNYSKDCNCSGSEKPAYVPKNGFGGFCSSFEKWGGPGYAYFPVGFPEKSKPLSCEHYFYSYVYKSPFLSNTRISAIQKYQKNNLTTSTGNLILDEGKQNNVDLIFTNAPSKFNKSPVRAVKKIPANFTSTSLIGLKHFTTYVITVKACRETGPEELNPTEKSTCSKPDIVTVRTQKEDYADNITSEVEHTVRKGRLALSWRSPENSNGPVVAFEIEYQRTYNKTVTVMKDCVPCKGKTAIVKHKINNLPIGTYKLRIRAVTLSGRGYFTPHINFEVANIDSFSSVELFAILFIVVGLGSSIIFILTCCFARRKYNAFTMIAVANPNYQYVPDHYEVERDYIERGAEIGEGTFGKVYEGVLKPENKRCAIKTVNDENASDLKQAFLREATVMKSLNKSNYIVKLLGVVSRDGPPWVLMELMELGDLKTYLRRIRNGHPLSIAITMKMANEIADAMAYMEALKFVHRDLAARNCMVDKDLTIKVGDFGMARDIYETDYYRKTDTGLLPIRWMAPECLRDGEFTSHSDMWSYGVVIWEILTMAEQPYQGLSNEQVLQDVMSGMKLNVPTHCPHNLRPILLRCWNSDPESRSTFMNVLKSLKYYHDEDFKKLAYFYTEEAEERKKQLTIYVKMNSVEEPLLENK